MIEFLLLTKETKADCLNYIYGLRKEPTMLVSIEEFKPSRSGAQNRLYWAALHGLSRETGNEADLLHEFFKRKFLGHHESLVMGEKVDYVPTTTKLTTKEFSEYVERIAAFCAQHGYTVSLPAD